MNAAHPPLPARRVFVEKGGVWVVAQFAVMAAWLLVAPLRRRIARSPSARIGAAILLCGGAAAGISGTVVLGESRTPFPKPPDKARLVQHGIYALVRHPLYLSLIALSFGWALLWRSLGAGVLAIVQAALLDAKARREEQWLRKRFPDYAAYSAKVRRLIPWIY